MKVGDVVKLNSGGPAMVVTSYSEGAQQVKVMWLDKMDVLQVAYFPSECVFIVTIK